LGIRKGRQEGAFVERLNIVRYSVVQGEEFAGTDFAPLIRQLNAHSALKQVNRNARDQDNVKVRMLDERFRTATAVAPPRVLISEFAEFIGKIEPEQWAGQERQPRQSAATSTQAGGGSIHRHVFDPSVKFDPG